MFSTVLHVCPSINIIPVSSCINFIYIIYSSIILRSITSSLTYYLLYGISYRLFIDYIIPLLSYSSCCGASGAVFDVLCLKVMIHLYWIGIIIYRLIPFSFYPTLLL